MEFIDSTGHIFSLPSYEDNPINLEYTENEYVFWLTDSSVSVKNYYIKPIRFIIDYKTIKNDPESFSLEIENKSQFYKLIGTKYLQERLEQSNSLSNTIGLDKSQFKDRLTLDDFYFDVESAMAETDTSNLIVTSANNSKFYMFPFYVVGFSEIEGTFLNNITIKYTYNENKENYTSITVGCSFIDECEELIINGRNMGIRLPKEILKAIYSSSFYTKYADEKLLKNKLKELLLNYMNIKGETGNFKSMMNSLKWFGWSNYVDISQLIKTDNHFQTQFILDHFNIESDIKDTFKYFNKTNNISLSVLANKETGKNYEQDFENTFIGEGKPVLENLFEKNVEVVKDDITFYKPYYNFMFNELALKLDCLKYYYQQYFLPIHININRASLTHKVYANTTKMSSVGFTTIVDKPVYIPKQADDIAVIFPDTDQLVFMQSQHLIDSKYNEFSNYNDEYENEDLYYVNENCITVPITITSNDIKYGNIENDIDESETIIDYETGEVLGDNEQTEQIIIYEKYLNCKLILTATNFVQNDKGHYVYINGQYLYKDKFYNNDFTETIDQITDDDIDDSYNFINYYGQFVKINPKYRYDIQTTCLINDNNFIFYQSNDQYYKNLVIIPRLLNNFIDWKNAYLRINLMVNNKWFTYDFRITIPNVYLDMGKLEYKYSIAYNQTEYYYPFNQLSFLSHTDVEFNSFIFEPDLVTIDTLFKNKDNDKVLTFIDKLLETDDRTHNASEYKMHEFYKKYYSNIVKIPYNKKYYNRIHLFDIYRKNDLTVADFITQYNDNFKYIIFKFNDEFNGYNTYGYFDEESDIVLGEAYIKDGDTYYWDNMDNNGQYYTDLALLYLQAYLLNHNLKCEKIYIEYKTGVKIDFKPIYKNNNLYVNVKGEKLKFLGIYKDVNLYNEFFNTTCTTKLDINEQISYDAYLMHNEKEWYMVFISQYPIASYPDSSLLDIQTNTYELDNYNIVYADYSIDKFLINRMNIIKSNGYNHFDKRDIVIASVNNNNYQFNIDLTNKWEVTKIYDINNVYTETSNVNIMIIPNNNADNMYTEGYYNVKLNYTIAGLDNQVYNAIAEYKIENNEYITYPTFEEIEYTLPEKTLSKISNFMILYETDDGKLKYSTKLFKSKKYHPIGIKIVNAGYFAPNSPAIYMGLKLMDCDDPDNGYAEEGSRIKHNGVDKLNPYWGFYDKEIEGLKKYPYIGFKYYNNNKVISRYAYPQTDDWENRSSFPKNADGTTKWPAANNRAFGNDPLGGNDRYINFLNDDDSINWDNIDENSAVGDWNGKLNTETIINNFDDSYPNWRTSPTITNVYNKKFSPAVACCWRYHTRSTKQGDWYMPSFAEVFFITYNFKKYAKAFEQIATLYPDDCKLDLITCIGNSAIWSSTVQTNTMSWEIHPCAHTHPLSRTQPGWYTIPFIQIKENPLNIIK